MEKSANYYLLENWKKKTSQRFYYCWDENKDRLKALIISVSLFLTVKFFWSTQWKNYQILIFYYFLLFLLFMVMLKHIKHNEEKFNNLNFKQFLDDLINLYLPTTFRNYKCYGFLLINRYKVPDATSNLLISKIRDSDVYSKDDSGICCCFLSSRNDLGGFQKNLEDYCDEIGGINHLKNNEIVFKYNFFNSKTQIDSRIKKSEYIEKFKKLFEKTKDKLQ